MQLTIGSNRLNNTDGIVTVRGREQIILEWAPFHSKLLLTMDLYGIGGKHVARLRRNYWTFNDRDRFEFSDRSNGFELLDTRSSQVVLKGRVVDQNSVVITQGTFYTSSGHIIEITTENWGGHTQQRSETTTAPNSTSASYSSEETASIRTAILSSIDTVQCPRCGSPLNREHMATGTGVNALLVSCIICRRNLVVRSRS